MPINVRWHQEHPMPERPTRAQRIRWHAEHAEQCGCRPVPPSLSAEVARRAAGVR